MPKYTEEFLDRKLFSIKKLFQEEIGINKLEEILDLTDTLEIKINEYMSEASWHRNNIMTNLMQVKLWAHYPLMIKAKILDKEIDDEQNG